MKLYSSVLFAFFVSSLTFGQGTNVHLRYRPSEDRPVVSENDIEKLARQGATLDAIDKRVTGINDN